MDEDTNRLEKEGIEHLEKIEQELEEIKELTGPTRWISFRNGIWQGAGAIIGSIIAIILLSFALSLLGVFPGLHDVVDYLQGVSNKVNGR